MGLCGSLLADARLASVRDPRVVMRKERETGCMRARVVDVYDGDTVTLLYLDALGRPRRRRARLVGFDAPELRGTDHVRALRARDFLRAKTSFRRSVRVHYEGLDKYGRLLVRFRLGDGRWVADAMLQEGLAVPMDARGRRM